MYLRSKFKPWYSKIRVYNSTEMSDLPRLQHNVYCTPPQIYTAAASSEISLHWVIPSHWQPLHWIRSLNRSSYAPPEPPFACYQPASLCKHTMVQEARRINFSYPGWENDENFFLCISHRLPVQGRCTRVHICCPPNLAASKLSPIIEDILTRWLQLT